MDEIQAIGQRCELADLIRAVVSNPHDTLHELFARMAFNALVDRDPPWRRAVRLSVTGPEHLFGERA